MKGEKHEDRFFELHTYSIALGCVHVLISEQCDHDAPAISNATCYFFFTRSPLILIKIKI